MTAHQLSQLSKYEPPTPATVPHLGVEPVSYNCHMAVMHWAFMALGKSHGQANARVAQLAVNNCDACNGKGARHATLPNSLYGTMFCSAARRIPGRDQLFAMASAGDVLITGAPSYPSHSMVVRQSKSNDHVTIRGFNNFGTIGTGEVLQYDPVSHNITKEKYWPGGSFGNHGSALWVISHAAYMVKAQHYMAHNS
ncbi:hypothetical protein [Oceanicola sp. 502str15]|uniref:hypothetical protein n=1 Tax=Oceanicola sp. 502str15 TaxID=2696061 RepID=UPI002094468C|nr:hypothetical protein [Oceanicola sp. 502str15]MCO6382729.1 hypothetical protein [Oceanicola sp. 502str15]